MVIVSNLYKDGEKFRRGKEHSHVTVQVSGVNSNCNSMVNLGANFALGFFGLQVARCQERLLPEIAGGIKEAGDFVFRFDWPPAIDFPLAGEGEVQAQVGVRVVFRVGSDFGEPGAGHHDAGGSNCVLVERSEEHTSELQSHLNLVCRLLLEKKKTD